MIEKILDVIASRANVDRNKITSSTNILDLDVDSLDVLNIVMDVEYMFNVRFEDEEIIELRTAEDIENILTKKFS